MEMLLQEALIGLSVGVPPGPKAAVCLSRTLTAGRRVGPLVVAGVFAGSAAWWATLTSAVGAMQRHLTDQHLGWAKRVTASAMGAYGLWPWPSSASGSRP